MNVEFESTAAAPVIRKKKKTNMVAMVVRRVAVTAEELAEL